MKLLPLPRQSLAVLSRAALRRQDYAVPVYEFTGQCLYKNGNHLEDFTGWTPALAKTD